MRLFRFSSLTSMFTVASLVTLGPTNALSADWNATGGSIADAAWSGDTPALYGENNVGALAGEGGVSGGSATYSIPINVVPGRAGLQPSISLNYSSNGGNGIAGVGWSLSATSSVSRCGKSAAQDGVTDKVHFLKAKDRLCLNGQRLVAVSGTYGNSATEYRTEIDSFVKVVQSGDMDGTGTSFTVIYKSGAVDTFGGTADSRHLPVNVTKTATWMISKSADVSGKNTINYEYTSHGYGEYTLARIIYTGEDFSLGDRYVEFDYEARPDVSNGYQSGGIYRTTQRLKYITTKYQTETVRQYRLTYAPSQTSANSLLKSAEECGYDNGTPYCLPPTVFAWNENAPTYKFDRLHYKNAAGQRVYPIATASVTAVLPKKDMNGDGTLDWPDVFLDSEGKFKSTNNYENLGACQLVQATYQSRCHNADFNHDGLTDSWKLTSGTTRVFQYAYAKYDGTTPTLISTPISLNMLLPLDEEILGIADLNGDGYSDILVRRGVIGSGTGTAKVEVFLHTKNHSAPYGSTGIFVYSITAQQGAGNNWVLDEEVQLLGDFDGNGIEDIFVFARDAEVSTAGNFAPQWYKPRFRKVLFSQSGSSYSSTMQTFGDGTYPAFPDPLPNYILHEMLFDINGDGLLDLLGRTTFGNAYQYKMNLGNGQLSGWQQLANSATLMTKLQKGIVPIVREQTSPGGGFGGFIEAYEEPRMVPAFVLDHDQDGDNELLIPYTRVVSFCFDHGINLANGQSTIQTFCDDEMYRVGEDPNLPQGPLLDINDRSVWEYYKVEFSVTGYSGNVPQYSVSYLPTDVVSSITDGAAADIYGNGHTDFITSIYCATTGTNCRFGNAAGNNDLGDYLDAYGVPLVAGPYMNFNAGSFGSAADDTDDYRVVDRMKSATTAMGVVTEWDYKPLNTGLLGPNYYDVDQSHLGTTPGYLHFSANISVVNQVRHSDGIGGLRAYDYKYRDATLSSIGRGFQGYEQIIVDDVANQLRSISSYHIKFPLSGELAETRRCVLSPSNPECASTPVSTTEHSYNLWRDGVQQILVVDQSTNYSAYVLEGTTTENRYWVSSNTATETAFETSSSHGAGTGALQPISVSSAWTHKTTTEQTVNANSCQTFVRNTYEEPSGANKSVSETSTALYSADTTSWWLCKPNYQTTLTKSITGRTGDYAAIESGSDAQKQIKTTFTWNPIHRKPEVVTFEALQGGGQPTRTTTGYNTYGLPVSVKIEGTKYNGAAYAMSDRDTTSTYSADGYFLNTITNDLGHVTTTVTEAKYGVATQVTDPNGRVTTMTYDHFGRLESSKAPGEPTIRYGYWWCSGINGGVVWCPDYDFARYKTLQQATGSPDVHRYIDRLDREVGSLTKDFENIDYYRFRVRYGNRGFVEYQSNRYQSNDGSTAKYTYFDGYDNLGRLTRKRTPQANDTYLQTDYSYVGQSVDIAATSSGVNSKILYMSRKLNGLGQLVTTTDANLQDTKYAYDGSGNPIAISDPDNNVITTSFNALGQKIWVHDPNAGDSNFQYSGLGELEWQQDANGDVLTYQYDDLGRIYNRWTNGVYSGIWRYDSTQSYGRKGMIDYEYNTTTTTDRLTKYYRYATTAGGKDYLSYNAHYIYESGSSSGNQHFTYYYVDSNFGRPKGLRYGATDIRLKYEYNSLGYMTHIKNAASGYIYREITDLDSLGNIAGSSIGNNVLTQVQAFHPATGQMTQNIVTKASGGSVVHKLEYDYDGFSNLYLSEVTASNGLANYETFDYDNLHRLDVSTRAYSSVSRSNDVIDYSYSSLGNITKKDDYFSTASYGNAARNLGGNAGPNAIRQITYAWGGTTNYSYDDNGNMLTGDGRTMMYNEFNKPLSISKSGVSSAFSYGADLQRYKQVKTGLPGGVQTSYYVDKLLEIEKQGTRTTYRHYFDGVAVLHKEVVGTTTNWKMAFNLKDRLDSVVTLADELGNVLEHRSYDPFGKPRRGDFIDAPPLQSPRVAPISNAGTIQLAIAQDPHPENALDPLTDRGFTDHEHLDEQQIIHMNGRVFDYNIGRFSAVDPYIQYPSFSQSLNPYSYILNNPLSGTDPSGYAARDIRNEQFQNHAKYSTGQIQRVDVTASVIVEKDGSKRIGTTTVSRALPQEGNGGGSERNPVGLKDGQYSDVKEGGQNNRLQLGTESVSQTDESDGSTDSRLSMAIASIAATGRYLGSYGPEIAKSQSVRASLAIAAGTSLADGPVPVGELIGAGIVVSVAGAVVIDKAANDIGLMIDSTRTWANRPGEVYTLRAAMTGVYPDVRGGTVMLQAGEIYKIGQTINPSTRYPVGVYRSLGLTYNTEFVGGQLQILMIEKLRLAGYVTEHGELPPGNRILR